MLPMNMICGVIAMLSALTAQQSPQRYVPGPLIMLPPALAEVSGLVALDDEHVLAHNDESGNVFRVNVTNGATELFLHFGQPAARGDFEGITISGDFIYLTTSSGLLFEVRREGAGPQRPYNVYDTGLGKTCEIEGLGATPDGSLLLVCKRAAPDDAPARLRIFRWRMDQRLKPAEVWADVPATAFLPTAITSENLAWTGIERNEATGVYMVLSSRGHVVLSLSEDGQPIGVMPLGVRAHPQAEGIALMPDGKLIIADEGGKAAGKLSVYRPVGD